MRNVIVEFGGTTSTTPVAGFGASAWATGVGEVFAEGLGPLSAIDIRYPDAELGTAPAVVEGEVGLSTMPAGDDGAGSLVIESGGDVYAANGVDSPD